MLFYGLILIEVAHVLQTSVNIPLALFECDKQDWEWKIESKVLMIDMKALIAIEACLLMWDTNDKQRLCEWDMIICLCIASSLEDLS